MTAIPEGAREESYPELWDLQPQAYVRLLAGARLREVHRFAAHAIEGRHREALHAAAAHALVQMLEAPYPGTVHLALDWASSFEVNRHMTFNLHRIRLHCLGSVG